MRKSKGFSLIELMIVVAIIGILAAIAIPQYQKYTARSQAAEGIILVNPAKAALGELYQRSGSIGSVNTNVAAAGLSATSGKYVNGITVSEDGTTATFVVTFGAKASSDLAGKTMNVAINASTGQLSCASGTTNGIDTDLLPSGCAN